MGIIKYICTSLFCEQTWKSIYLTSTLLKKLFSTSSRDKFNRLTLSSWTSNAQCAIPSTQSTRTPRESLYANPANTSFVCQKEEKENFALAPPGEERETEPTEVADVY